MSDTVAVTLTAKELYIINNALNEARELLLGDPDEFQTRMGTNVSELEEVLTKIHTLVEENRKV